MSIKNLIPGKLVKIVLQLLVGGFYLWAGGTKIADPGKFAEAVANYRILPHELINGVAITLPWIEIAAGLCVILGIWLRAGAWLLNLMTLVFIVAISSAVSRGLNIECGCFGTVGGRHVGLRAIGEDVLLLVFGLSLLWIARSQAQKLTIQQVSPSAPEEG